MWTPGVYPASSHAGITNYIKDRNALDFISAHQRPAGSLAADDAGVSVIDYFNNRSEGTAQSTAGKHAPNLSSPEATEVQRLRAQIQATLGWSVAGELNRGQQYGSQG
ncbi:hypothetical protein ACVMH6_000067 [Rhizobium leguminosarum]